MLPEVEEIVTAAGFVRYRETKKVIGFRHPTLPAPIYIRCDTVRHYPIRLVVSPSADVQRVAQVDGAEIDSQYLHHSNLVDLPKRQHRGEGEISFGRQLRCRDLQAFATVIQLLAM